MGRIYDFIRKVGYFINPQDNQGSLSVEEIAERMKPIPYKEIESKLPKEFGRTVRRILEAEKQGPPRHSCNISPETEEWNRKSLEYVAEKQGSGYIARRKVATS